MKRIILIKNNKKLIISFFLSNLTAGLVLQLQYLITHLNFQFPESLRTYSHLDKIILGPIGFLVASGIVVFGIYNLLKNNENDNSPILNKLLFAFSLPALSVFVPLFHLPKLWYDLILMMPFVLSFFLLQKNISEFLQSSTGIKGDLSVIVFLCFFFSGFAAILYQLIWQRSLFTFFGSNIESVTIIVSAFMLGLGLGSIIGGFISHKVTDKLIHIFSLVELLIGIFGLFSLWIFKTVGNLLVDWSYIPMSIAIFLLILFPTMLMGSTLPLLIEHFNRTINNLGKTVANFYFINTMGSAIGALLGTITIFRYSGMNGAIYVACAMNFFVAVFIFYRLRNERSMA